MSQQAAHEHTASQHAVAQQYRVFLLGLAAFIFAGTALELWLVEHAESAVQLVPFALCGLGLGSAGAALFVPRRGVLLTLRTVMGIVALGSLFGVYEHAWHNLAFELDIRPGAAVRDVLWEALSGASPLMAPGILALAAVLAAAATYQHPALAGPQGAEAPTRKSTA